MSSDHKNFGASPEDIALLTFFNSAEIKAFLRTMVHTQARILAHLEDRSEEAVLAELNQERRELLDTLAQAEIKRLKVTKSPTDDS